MIRSGNLLHFLKKSEHSTHLFHLSNVQNSLCMHSSITESFIPQIRTSGVKVMWAFIGRNKNRVIAVQRDNGSVWGFGCISVNRWMGAVRLAHRGPSRLLCITLNLCLCNFAPETLFESIECLCSHFQSKLEDTDKSWKWKNCATSLSIHKSYLSRLSLFPQLLSCGCSFICYLLRRDKGGRRWEITASPAVQKCSVVTTLYIIDCDGTIVHSNC